MPVLTPVPLQIFSWQQPFLPALKQYIASLGAEAILIVPNNRPWRYLQELYRQSGNAAVTPKMLKIDDVVDVWLGASHAGRTASLLDCVAILYQCVQQVTTEDDLLNTYFGNCDLQHFLPWGKHLARLAEDMFRHMVTPQDLHYLEGEVSAPAAALLGAIGKIGVTYRHALVEADLMTQGLEYYMAGERASDIPPMLKPGPFRHIVIAGFCQLDTAEEKLLHTLWQAGAHVCLHTDPDLALGKEGHWACAPHRQWIARWHASVATQNASVAKNTGPEFTFFEGYDYHSQLAALRDDLQKQKTDLTSTAIILADSNLLVPTLGHLPQTGVNISMGFPLLRSQLAQLCNSVLSMHARAFATGKFFWRDVVQCLQQPWLTLLGKLTDGGNTYHERLQALQQKLRSKERYINQATVVALLDKDPADSDDILTKLLDLLLQDTTTLTSCSSIANWLKAFLDLFPAQNAAIWQQYPLEAEVFYRIRHSVLPALRDNLLSHKEFPFAVLHSIVNEHFEQERVPFEADPITGLQVIGLLETRLLQFDHVYFLDATDDKLPGNPAQDPLLPDSLRSLMGLPDAHRQEAATAYNVYRLVACARDVRLYWQEGMSHSSLFDAKKSRSRFVEQWIWQEEQKRSALLKRGEPPLYTARCMMEPLVAGNASLAKTPALASALAKLLQKKLSATMLNAYLQCPLAFARRYLLGLQTPATITEGDDPAAVGICLHSMLEQLYKPFVGKTVHPGDITYNDINTALASALRCDEIHNLPADSALVLEIMARKQVNAFISQQNALETPPHILALEKEVFRTLSANGKNYTLFGYVDRIDERAGKAVILDYKTGTPHLPKTDLWTAEDFFARIERLLATPLPQGAQECADLYDTLVEDMPNVQLPVYIALLAEMTPEVGNACLVALKTDCDEKFIFSDLDDTALVQARRYCELAVGLVLRQMETATAFAPDESGKSCEWCPYAGLCPQ